MKRMSVVIALGLATSAQAADLEGASLHLRGGHLNAGGQVILEPVGGPTPGLGSAGATLGGSPTVGESSGPTLSVAPGFWPLESALAVEAPDGDADGVPDHLDNCSAAPNPEQLDADWDGYGNACDADYDNDGFVGLADFNRLRLAVGSQLGDASYDPVVDYQGDGGIGLPDFNFLRSSYSGVPGPSGLDCAGVVPCVAP